MFTSVKTQIDPREKATDETQPVSEENEQDELFKPRRQWLQHADLLPIPKVVQALRCNYLSYQGPTGEENAEDIPSLHFQLLKVFQRYV